MALLLFILSAGAFARDDIVLAPGDIDGNGVHDLIRVDGDTAVVHVLSANKTRRYSFQALEEFDPPEGWTGTRESPWATSARVVPDLNTNGSPEILVAGATSFDATFFCGCERFEGGTFEIWDPMTRTKLSSGPGGSRFVVSIADQNSDGVRDVATAVRYWRPMIRLADAITGLWLPSQIEFDWRADAVQVLSNAEGVGLLVQGRDRRVNGEEKETGDYIELRDPESNETTKRVWLGKGHFVRQALALPDTNDNWSWEWAVLRTTDRFENEGNQTTALVVDQKSGKPVRTINFTGWAQPKKLMVVNGRELAVVSRFGGSGAQPLEVRDARTGAQLLRVWFPKTLTIESVTRTPDMNGNGSNEVAVIGEQWAGKPWSKIVTLIRDSRTGQWVRRLIWES